MSYPNGIGYESSNMKYDYTQYSHDNDINVIPAEDYKRLVTDTFKTICDVMRKTYGPYGSSVIMNELNQTTATKDGYNTFEQIHFSHNYKQQVYLAIQEIINRVNETVGDGTTSCILLAEKMFNELKDVAKNADEERKVKQILESIEKYLQDPDHLLKDHVVGIIRRMNKQSFYNMIKVASNYDDNLTDNLVKAMDPVFDGKDDVVSVRNVIVDIDHDNDVVGDVEYSYDYLPGDYRINIAIHPDLGREWVVPQKMRILVCDHAFNASDWMKLENGRIDTEVPVLIIARAVTQDFFDNVYTKKYAVPMLSTNQPLKYYVCEMAKGGYVKNEIQDLCAVLGINPMTFETAGPIDLDYYTKEYTFSIRNGNCMCFEGCTPATDYVETLKFEMKSDMSKSITKKSIWESRINACLLKDKDTLFKIKTSNKLQSKLIADKITDCCSIIKSGVENGVVPNLFLFGHYRMGLLINDTNSDFERKICERIRNAIEGLFDDIWYSKYGEFDYDDERIANETLRDQLKHDHYYGFDDEQTFMFSFDIVSESHPLYHDFPTSVRYDIEVISAGISIVKYMLTSKAFIFDSCLLKSHGDKGHVDPYAY